MRFSLEIKLLGSPPFELPTNYRINIASLLKESLRQNNFDLYKSFWIDKKRNIAKPFTFSTYIPDAKSLKKKEQNSLIFQESKIILNISSCDPSVLIQFYNALLNLKNYSPFKYPIELRKFNLHRQIEFNEKNIIFKTLSPVIVRRIIDKKGVGYLSFEDPEFEDAIRHEIINLSLHFFDSKLRLVEDDINVVPYNCRKVRIYHYKETIDATSGLIEIFAPKDIIELVFNAGLGARRSQGFGMVDIA